MLFNSFEFLIFFPTVCIIYFLLGKNKFRNPFLLVASYYFYMNWKPIYALLILTSTILTYVCGLLVEKHFDDTRKKKMFLVISLVLNFSILFVFKYFNFINDSVYELLSFFGLRWNVPNLDILLPVGISFYTFQAVGYSVDVYRGTIKAEKNFFTYALFVSFFPQLVAGPIERAKNLLPQFHEEHSFKYDDVAEGFKQMLWGFFMKLCVADRLSAYVDAVYNNVGNHNGTSMIVATKFFTFQIYCDFGGYSNIAIGAARVMGFRLMENFKRPYLSMSVKEFWKRWHISLSSWFMDYVYIPLGGNRVKYGRHLLNLMITFLVSGIWHGANWTFFLWGALHGTYLVIGNVFRRMFRFNDKVFRVGESLLKSGTGPNDGYEPLLGTSIDTTEIKRNEPSKEMVVDAYSENNIHRVLQLCKDKSVHLVLVSSPRFRPKGDNELIRSLSQKYDVPYIEIYNTELFNSHPNWFKDASHLNNDGAIIFTQLFFEELKPYLAAIED